MKKFLLPAAAAVMMVASQSAFAAGPWYVLYNMNTNACTAAHHVGSRASQTESFGPFPSQVAALAAQQHIAKCGGSFAEYNPASYSGRYGGGFYGRGYYGGGYYGTR